MRRIRTNRATVALVSASLAAGAGAIAVPQLAIGSGADRPAGAPAPPARPDGHRPPPPPHAIGVAQHALRLGPPARGADALKERAERFADIGKALGTDGDHVTAAVHGAIDTVLQADVKAGRITSAQAAAILTAWDTATPPDAAGRPADGRRPPRRPSREQSRHEEQAFRAEVAAALNVSADKLADAIGDAAEEYSDHS
jgi:hypothetical protein